jgi:hypothetical protein
MRRRRRSRGRPRGSRHRSGRTALPCSPGLRDHHVRLVAIGIDEPEGDAGADQGEDGHGGRETTPASLLSTTITPRPIGPASGQADRSPRCPPRSPRTQEGRRRRSARRGRSSPPALDTHELVVPGHPRHRRAAVIHAPSPALRPAGARLEPRGGSEASGRGRSGYGPARGEFDPPGFSVAADRLTRRRTLAAAGGGATIPPGLA